MWQDDRPHGQGGFFHNSDAYNQINVDTSEGDQWSVYWLGLGPFNGKNGVVNPKAWQMVEDMAKSETDSQNYSKLYFGKWQMVEDMVKSESDSQNYSKLYFGQWRNGRRHGRGIMMNDKYGQYDRYYTYVGTFKDDYFHGNGAVSFLNKTYIGTWRNVDEYDEGMLLKTVRIYYIWVNLKTVNFTATVH